MMLDNGACPGQDECVDLQKCIGELKQKEQEYALLLDKYDKLFASYIKLEEKYAQSYTVQLILEEISRELDTEQLLKKTTDIVMGVFGSNRCTIYMADEAKESLIATASSAVFGSEELNQPISISSNNLAARSWRNRKVYTEADLRMREIEELKARSTTSVLAIPLTGRRGCLGVLTIEHKTVGRFKNDVIEFAKLIAQELSLSVENAYLYGKMKELATHDALTGVYNRMYLINYFVDLFAKEPGMVSVIMFDMDHFKIVNDKYGHFAGDLVLKTTTSLVQKMLPAGIIARYGGEEFVIVLPGMGQEETFSFAESMRAKIAEHQFISAEGDKIPVTLSAGLATYPLAADNHEDLLKLADEALYEAKNTGRNKVCAAGSGH